MTRQNIAILGTGGTIAGKSSHSSDHTGYTSGVLSVQDLVAAIPDLQGRPLLAESVAQIDSKDAGPALWVALVQRLYALLADPSIGGVVITHGTDTLEETALFLHGVLGDDVLQGRPVVLTAAMRPATALVPDGPQNLWDAVQLAQSGQHMGLSGVMVCVAGQVWSGAFVRKVQTYRLDAFAAGERGPLAVLENGALRVLQGQEAPKHPSVNRGLSPNLWPDASVWPRIEVLVHFAGNDGEGLRQWLASERPPWGVIVAGTGNGTVSQGLQSAMDQARRQGVQVQLATRCPQGALVGHESHPCPDASPWAARVHMLVQWLKVQSLKDCSSSSSCC